MKQKTRLLSNALVSEISRWENVECILLSETAHSDTLHPYFVLILDVYYHGALPALENRRKAYGENVSAFESSALNRKDRFLVGEIPVRVEYKACANTNERVDIVCNSIDQLWKIKDSGTYIFHRITNGEVLFKRSAWIDEKREMLSRLSDEFWSQVRNIHLAKMEHYLADLGAAMVQDDDFNYLVSAADFIKHACMAVFCINHRFEPSHRYYSAFMQKMETLPDQFMARFDAFLQSGEDMPKDRRFSIAQLIARSILALL